MAIPSAEASEWLQAPRQSLRDDATQEGLEKERVVHVFWLDGEGCDGCSISTLGATTPPIEDLLRGTIPGVPRVMLHSAKLSVGWVDTYMDELYAAWRGERDPYVVVVEGSVPNEALIEGEGYFIALGEEDGHAVTMCDWLDRLSPGAAATIAIGTCATWGGVPASKGNATDAMSTMDFLGRDYRSVLGLPVINVAGCAPIGDNFTELVLQLLLYVGELGPMPELDPLGRPAWLLHETVHRNCPRGSYYEEGTFAKEYGGHECLVDLGCWGPVVRCNMTSRGAIKGTGGCMNMGGKCIGCTMPGFPDKFTPYFKKPPGSMVSGNSSRLLGRIITPMRRWSLEHLDRETRWDERPGIGERLYQWMHKRDARYDRNKTLSRRPDKREG